MKAFWISIAFTIFIHGFSQAEQFNFRTIADTQISDIALNACNAYDAKGINILSLSIFGKTPSRLTKNCTTGVVIIPDYHPFLNAFADDDEMSFVKKIYADIDATGNYFYKSQTINVEYENYRICSYNTCSSDVFFFLYTYERR